MINEKNMIRNNLFNQRIKNNEIVLLKGKKFDTYIGYGLQLKINVSVGLSEIKDYVSEIDKIKRISEFDVIPDSMMDLSIVNINNPLYCIIQEEIGCPVGTVPVYKCFDEKIGIDKNILLEEIEKQAQSGVSFMTFHFSAIDEIYRESKDRNVPVISRGGSLLLRDIYLNKRKENILLEYFDEICKILKKYSVVASVGTTFRPSNLYDALDKVHIKEIALQKQIISLLREKGINVIMEGIGHISLNDLNKYVDLIRKDFYVPFMPLGPIVTDQAVGWDHISSAIGASNMALMNGADIINAVTREEHTGGIPSVDSIYEAVKSAQVVVHCINDVRFFEEFNKKYNSKRINCMEIVNDKIGCARCRDECPFLLNN